MHTAVEQPGGDELGRPQWLMAYQVVSGLTAALVLIMAVLAGRGWFLGNFDLIDVHGVIGNIVFLSVLAQAGLAVAVGLPRSFRTQLLIINVALIVLVIAQIGLGYTATSGTGGEAAAWHIPNGVLIFGLTVYHLAVASRLRR